MDKDGAELFGTVPKYQQSLVELRVTGLFRRCFAGASREQQVGVMYTPGSRCLGRSEPILVDTEAANLRFKRLARNSQLGRCTGGARDSSLALR